LRKKTDLFLKHGDEILKRYIKVMEEMGSDMKELQKYPKETNFVGKETNSEVKKLSLSVKEMKIDVNALQKTLKSLEIKITFSITNDDSFNDDLHSHERSYEAFKKGVNEFFLNSTYEVFLQSAKKKKKIFRNIQKLF